MDFNKSSRKDLIAVVKKQQTFISKQSKYIAHQNAVLKKEDEEFNKLLAISRNMVGNFLKDLRWWHIAYWFAFIGGLFLGLNWGILLG